MSMRFTLLLALAIAPAAFAQTLAPTPGPISGCPVEVISAQYTARAHPQPMLDPKKMDTTRVYGTLRIRYRNTSGKAIRDLRVQAHFTPRSGVAPPLYLQPDPNAQTFTIEGMDDGATRDAVERVTVDATGLMLLAPERVTFRDGTAWQANPQNTAPDGAPACSYMPPATIKPAAKK